MNNQNKLFKSQTEVDESAGRSGEDAYTDEQLGGSEIEAIRKVRKH